ncbi:MAG: cupin domain-containing protein [Planctomycetes bacterium]|nr:cupin domain-containing protein [Planctomycetota bacterium]
MSRYFPETGERARHTIFPGVNIAACAGDKLMLSLVDMLPHAVVEEHEHPHEQAGMILSGKAIFIIGGEQKTLRAGDMYLIPGNVRHKVIALDEPVQALDIFQPVRTEYL